ncbi:winged helix-turn-helix transcriptional regulator [Seongchinamella sediminis]|uniref:Leucine-responsive regulatory protein n=1 Tax=Seongchinamella sediminis TaxID=2283635 RepID=A0A3L7DZZ4_9GAMM|nr:Lrp/AsnC ligand binding domain-containing protein [Seongchinamella sediminis]RLQ23167.1 winged helix-turn-helix transcriptional regulator [Seongchinamella sediminis]
MSRSKPLDRTDRLILQVLQRDGRISNVDLAKKVALSPTPCLERVKRLEKAGYIRGYVALLDAAKLNASTQAFIQVSLANTSTSALREFNQRMRKLEEVVSCHMVAGGFDYLLQIRCADMRDYQRFLGEKLAAIPLIGQTHTYVVIEEVKADTAVSLDYIDP